VADIVKQLLSTCPRLDAGKLDSRICYHEAYSAVMKIKYRTETVRWLGTVVRESRGSGGRVLGRAVAID
jgi:hypothetical protein